MNLDDAIKTGTDEPEALHVQNTIHWVHGLMVPRKSKFSDFFYLLFGFQPPRELEHWLGVKHWLVDELHVNHRDYSAIIDWPYYLSNNFITQFLQPADRADRVPLALNTWESSIAVLTGLLFAGTSADGDAVYLRCDMRAPAGFCEVYRWNQTSRRIDRKLGASFSQFILEVAKLHLMDLEDDTGKEESPALHHLKEQLHSLNLLVDCPAPAEDAVLTHCRRSHWLTVLLTEKMLVPGEDLAEITHYSVWKNDEPRLRDNPLLVHYWLFAHFFLDNEPECQQCIELALTLPGLLTQALALQFQRLLDKPASTPLGSLTPEMIAAFKAEIGRYRLPLHHPPEHRALNLDEKNTLELSPFSLIKAVRDNDLRRIQKLLDAGQDVNEPYEYDTALAMAAQTNHLGVAKLLLDHNAQVDVPSLHWAVIQGNLAMLRTLLFKARRLASLINERYYFGQSLLHCSIKSDHKSIFNLLLQQGANPNIATEFKETPLMEAASRGRFDYIDGLVKQGAKIDFKDDDQRSALHYAAESSLKCLQRLLKYEPKINTRDSHRRTPLMIAAASGNLHGVRLLIKHGAQIGLRDEAGHTAEDMARAQGHEELAVLVSTFSRTD